MHVIKSFLLLRWFILEYILRIVATGWRHPVSLVGLCDTPLNLQPTCEALHKQMSTFLLDKHKPNAVSEARTSGCSGHCARYTGSLQLTVPHNMVLCYTPSHCMRLSHPELCDLVFVRASAILLPRLWMTGVPKLHTSMF